MNRAHSWFSGRVIHSGIAVAAWAVAAAIVMAGGSDAAEDSTSPAGQPNPSLGPGQIRPGAMRPLTSPVDRKGLAKSCGDDVLDLLWRKSDYYFHEGDYENAIRLHRLIVDFEPDFTEAYSVGAWLLESLGREKEGLQFLEQGLAANRKVYDLYFELGFYYFKRQDFQKAREYFSDAVKLEHPSTVDRMLAHACEKQGDLAAARDVWKGILKDNPTDAVALRNLQRIEGKIGGAN